MTEPGATPLSLAKLYHEAADRCLATGTQLWDFVDEVVSDRQASAMVCAQESLGQLHRLVEALKACIPTSSGPGSPGRPRGRPTRVSVAPNETFDVMELSSELWSLAQELGRLQTALGRFALSIPLPEDSESLRPLKVAVGRLSALGADLVAISQGLRELGDDIEANLESDVALARRVSHMTQRMKSIGESCFHFREDAAVALAQLKRASRKT